MMIGDSYGIGLDPTPTVIPSHDVIARIEAQKRANGGKPIRVLRNGMLIKIRGDRDAGVWQIRSIENDGTKGLLRDLSSPGMIPYREGHKAWCKRDVSLRTALKGGIEILPRRYTGHPVTD